MALFGKKEGKSCKCGNCSCGKIVQDMTLEGSEHTFKILGSG